MNKKEFIKKYGEEAYEKQLEQSRERNKKWREVNPEKMAEVNNNISHKGGKYYEKMTEYNRVGLRSERKAIRGKHQNTWRQYKNIIAPTSQIHHQWRPGTAEYDGVALVEKDQHMHGFIDVIEILGGKITVYTEKELQAT